ncbi:MAG: hypothetical protein AAGI23_06495 [Bacteroidota bacterium]
MVFDYYHKLSLNNTTVSQKEKEIVAVYGPYDIKQKASTWKYRENRYKWVIASNSGSPGLRVQKAPRQGEYDNMHCHARMKSTDIEGNIQLHAPFCGHSCIHTHWRWSNISGSIADKYKGWSSKGAFTALDQPKVPYNQKVTVAICNTNRGPNSFSDTNILDPSNLSILSPSTKIYWYRVEVIDPNANEQQVLMEQGIGWAYRYSTPDESESIADLSDSLLGPIKPSSSWSSPPTQKEMSTYFENDVYPVFRYKDKGDQIPEGNHNKLHNGGTDTSMEDL